MKIRSTLASLALLAASASAFPHGAHGSDFGSETFALINAYRSSRGLPRLEDHGTLKALARDHSSYQATRGTMNHDGFHQRRARSSAAGTGARCAENVGVRYRNAQQLFEGWRNSKVHNENLLRPHLRYAAVSVVGSYATFFACG